MEFVVLIEFNFLSFSINNIDNLIPRFLLHNRILETLHHNRHINENLDAIPYDLYENLIPNIMCDFQRQKRESKRMNKALHNKH